jgi:hypothetical protein
MFGAKQRLVFIFVIVTTADVCDVILMLDYKVSHRRKSLVR